MHKTEYIKDILSKMDNFLASSTENKKKAHAILIECCCKYFDFIKEQQGEFSLADKEFLFYVANKIGVPRYYHMLSEKFQKNISFSDLNLSVLTSVVKSAKLCTTNEIQLHIFQKEILDLYNHNNLKNRYFLSASTSFGKTFLVYEIIKKMDYKNVLLIFPTLALLSENYEKLLVNKNYKNDFQKYTLHTLSLSENIQPEGYNIFLFTPERYLSFIENSEVEFQFDFVFIDEIYKIDNDFIIDEEQKENERDVAYRIATFFANLKTKDILLAGPYIDLKPNSSFKNFLVDNNIKALDYNCIELVNKTSSCPIKGGKSKSLFSQIEFILNKNENTLVYCQDQCSCERYAKNLLKQNILTAVMDTSDNPMLDFISHLEHTYGSDWTLIECLKHGIAFHHSLIPKYIQKEIINYFNLKIVKVLFSTTTITEGVNTSAKNMIVLHSKKGEKILKKFDAQNIQGRAGRFSEHFSGNLIVLDKQFNEILNRDTDNVLQHRNYDLNKPKDTRDILYVNPNYLNSQDRKKRQEITALIRSNNLPKEIITHCKMFDIFEKCKVLQALNGLQEQDWTVLSEFMSKLNNSYMISLTEEGFNIIINVLKVLDSYSDELKYFLQKADNYAYSRLFYALKKFFKKGFAGTLEFNKEHYNKTDDAIRKTSRTVFQIFKYELVKYLSLFDLLYRYVLQKRGITDETLLKGLTKLISKLEYHAITPKGIIAGDYGASFNVIRYFDNEIKRSSLDLYEISLVERIERIIPTHVRKEI